MSATLTWHATALQAQTAATNTGLINDMVSCINSKSGDANFKWQVAGSSNSNVFYVLLSRKDASAGRLLYVIWSSAPAGNNAAILGQAPSTNSLYCAWFPAGTANVASNLSSSSGTIAGDDTGAVKVGTGAATSTIYAASAQVCWFDSAEGGFFLFNNPTGSTTYIQGAGALVVDSADVAYDCVISSGSGDIGGMNSIVWTYQLASTSILAGVTTPRSIRTNYGATDRLFFQPYLMQSWITTAIGADDIRTDTSAAKAWFVPFQLVGRTKGIGFALKLRQIAYGPATTGAFTIYNSTGPVTQAIAMMPATSGATAHLWAVNFKI